MNITNYTKKMYDKYGKAYVETRNKKLHKRSYNEYCEMPAMIKAVGKIRGKTLLDVGCGSGSHIKKYYALGAKCYGIDISKTMIEIAKEECPQVNFRVGALQKLPYKNGSFDIVTASLCIDYVSNLEEAFKEISRVLKKGGLFYYSNNSEVNLSRARFENKDLIVRAVGSIYFKDSKTRIGLGNCKEEKVITWDMDLVDGMVMKSHKKTLRTQLLALRSSGLELIDLIDCYPTRQFKKYNPKEYPVFSKFPVFTIYVSRKK
jgi:ubiquinone/menaquinone biosynthesis C-methylase UbiE